MTLRDGAIAAVSRSRRGNRRGTGRLGTAVLGSLVAKTFELATLVLLATMVPRALGPSDFGRFSVLLTIVTLGSLALTLGGPTVMVRFVPAAPEAERVALARAIGARLARGRAAQLAVLGIVACTLVAVDAAAFPAFDAVMVFLALALNVGTSLGLQMTLGLGKTGAWSTRFPMQNAVLIVAVLVLYPRFGMTGASVAILVSAVSGAVVAMASINPVLSGEHPRVAVPPGAIRFGALQASAAALTQCTQRGGVLVVALLAGSSAQTGFAALATGIALGVTYAILQTFTVAVPHVSHDHAPSDRAHGGEPALHRLAVALESAILPAAALGAVLCHRLVPAMFGSDYEGATAAFGPAVALMVLAPLGALLVQVSALRLRPEVALRSAAVAAGVFAAVAIVAVPSGGAAGGTAAALAATAAGCIVGVRGLPGAVSGRLLAMSLAGSAVVLVLASLT